MATAHRAADQIDSMQALEPSEVESEQEHSAAENYKEQAMIPSDLSRDAQNHFGYTNEGDEHGSVAYPPNIYTPQPPQMLFYGGHENPAVGREDYPHNLYAEGLEVGPNAFYNENSPFMFHTGYGYSPHIPYGPYSPVMPPLPPVNGDIHPYSAQNIPFSGTYYQQQQPIPPAMPYLSYPTSLWECDANVAPDSLNSSSLLFRQITGCPLSYDWLSQDGSGSVNPFSPLTAPPQPIRAPGPFPQSTIPVPYAMNQRPFGFGSSYGSYDAPHSYEELGPNFGDHNRRLAPASKCKKQEKESAPPISCNGCQNFLHEQNRGPRASRPKKQSTEEDSLLENKNEEPYFGLSRELFITEYEVAMFFVIKSFSEDNIHKSIKYGVWASTPSGNKKLDSAYRGAKEREDPCPVFLLFSVNASGHFCGVAEMIGAVDFAKSVDFWQQNRWSGCFPVKWRIVKDVPNNLFRHIVLENNDNKSVSNSRDTQEVNLEQGLEMLSIFKNHKAEVSILDDFGFYDEREKAILENKQKRAAVSADDAVNRISDNFSQAIQIVESNNAEIRI